MNRSRSRDNSPGKVEDFRTKKLYISNLPEAITNDEVSDLFSEFGNISDVFVKNKEGFSFAFVEFSSIAQAEKALKGMNMQSVKGKDIKVAYSKPRPPREDNGGGRGGFNGGGGGFRGGDRDRERSRDNERGSRNGGGGGGGGGDRVGDRPKGCFNCGQNGHFSRQCPEPKKERNGGGFSRDGNGGGGRRDFNNGGNNRGGNYGGNRNGGGGGSRNSSPCKGRDSPIRSNKAPAVDMDY